MCMLPFSRSLNFARGRVEDISRYGVPRVETSMSTGRLPVGMSENGWPTRRYGS